MNEVLADVGVLLTLELFGGGEHEAKGIVSRLRQSPSQVKTAFSMSGWMAWIESTPRDDEIEFVRHPDGTRRRAIHVERIGGAYSPGRRTTTKIALQEVVSERPGDHAGRSDRTRRQTRDAPDEPPERGRKLRPGNKDDATV